MHLLLWNIREPFTENAWDCWDAASWLIREVIFHKCTDSSWNKYHIEPISNISPPQFLAWMLAITVRAVGGVLELCILILPVGPTWNLQNDIHSAPWMHRKNYYWRFSWGTGAVECKQETQPWFQIWSDLFLEWGTGELEGAGGMLRRSFKPEVQTRFLLTVCYFIIWIPESGKLKGVPTSHFDYCLMS